jgi:hypothetical protein
MFCGDIIRGLSGCVLPSKTRRSARARHGLAPVELVIAIPILLFAMALSVIVGNAACWKIRATVVARNEIWSSRMPRTSTPADPWPAGWPQSATMNHSGSRSLPDLNFPVFQNPLVRGGAPLTNVTVNTQLLDPTRSVHIGQSHIQPSPPMLAKRVTLQPFDVNHPLIDGPWAYWQTGQWDNWSRRIPDLYPSMWLDANSPAMAMANQIAGTYRPAVDVFDRDAELCAWYGNYIDFHPSVRTFCTLDAQLVHDRYIADPRLGILGRIAGIPQRIGSTFLRMYKAQLQILQAMQPPPADAQAQMALLQQKIDILEDYLASLN